MNSSTAYLPELHPIEAFSVPYTRSRNCAEYSGQMIQGLDGQRRGAGIL